MALEGSKIKTSIHAGHKVSLISKAETFYRIRHGAVAFLSSLTLLMARLRMVILMVMEYNCCNDDIKTVMNGRKSADECHAP